MTEKSTEGPELTKTGPETTSTPATGSTGAAGSSQSSSAKSGHRRLPQLPPISADVKAVRLLVARLVWAVCVLFALVLAAAVLMITIDANPANDLVRFVVDFSTDIDLGFFSLTDPVKDFDRSLGAAQDTKTALFNYGICAIAWLLIGRIADRVIRP